MGNLIFQAVSAMVWNVTDLYCCAAPGLGITFFFLALNAACKPFCTEGLSRLSALTLIAQFITLYGGVVLIVEDFIRKERSASNEEDNTSNIISAIYGLVYISNAAVCVWPAIQVLLAFDYVQYVQSAMKRFSSRTETQQDNEKNDLNPPAEPPCLDSVTEHRQGQSVAEHVDALEPGVSEFPVRAIQDESMQFQEHAHERLGRANPGPALLHYDVQEARSELVFDTRQETEQVLSLLVGQFLPEQPNSGSC
jgi:hypothetical protein